MDIAQIILTVVNLSVVATMFAYGLYAKAEDIIYLFRSPRLLTNSLVAMFIVAPVTALALGMLIELPLAAKVAMVTLAMSPVTPALPRKLRETGGHQSYAVSLAVAVILLSILIIPAMVEFLGRLMHREFAVDLFPVVRLVFSLALGPLFIGMVVRRFFPNWAERSNAQILRVANIVLLIAVLALLILVFPIVWDSVGTNVLIAFTLFNVISVAIGHLMGGPDQDHSVVLALSSASRHPAMALTIASATYPGENFAAAVILCTIVNVLVSGFYLKWQQRQRPGTFEESGVSPENDRENPEPPAGKSDSSGSNSKSDNSC